MVTTRTYAKAETTEFVASLFIERPGDYPEAVGAPVRLPTRAAARGCCEEAMLTGSATIAEVAEVLYEAVEYTDAHYGRVRDAEECWLTIQGGWLSADGTVKWDDPAEL